MAYVKLVSAAAESSSWVEVEVHVSDDVADFADRACTKFRSWDADASQVSLYRVERTGEDVPDADAERTALNQESLQPTWSLARAGIAPNSCILVRKTAGAAAGACACSWGGRSRTAHLPLPRSRRGGWGLRFRRCVCGAQDGGGRHQGGHE